MDKNTNGVDASQLINSAMNSEAQSGTRQRDLTLYFLENEVTWSKDELVKFFLTSGADRTDAVTSKLRVISASYAGLVDTSNGLKVAAKGRADKKLTEAEALQIESNNGKIRAANIVFTRALIGVYHLRTIEADDVKAGKNGTLSYVVPSKEKTKKGDVIFTKVTQSSNALIRLGTKDVDAIPGKPASSRSKVSTTASNPAKGGISNAADVVGTFLDMNNKQGKFDYGDDEETSMDKLFHNLVVAKFSDGKGVIDMEALTEYVEAEFEGKLMTADLKKAAKATKSAPPKAKPDQRAAA